MPIFNIYFYLVLGSKDFSNKNIKIIITVFIIIYGYCNALRLPYYVDTSRPSSV